MHSEHPLQVLFRQYSQLMNANINALKECVTDMLSLPGKAPIYIILDALDECPNIPRNQSTREEVLKPIEVVNFEIPNYTCVWPVGRRWMSE